MRTIVSQSFPTRRSSDLPCIGKGRRSVLSLVSASRSDRWFANTTFPAPPNEKTTAREDQAGQSRSLSRRGGYRRSSSFRIKPNSLMRRRHTASVGDEPRTRQRGSDPLGAWQGRSAAHGSRAAGYLLRCGPSRQGRDFEKPQSETTRRAPTTARL